MEKQSKNYSTQTSDHINPESLSVDIGLFFIDTMREIAMNTPDISSSYKKDWNTLAKWLGYTNGNLTQEQHKKAKLAWTSYLARGISPSKHLEESFTFHSRKIKEQNIQTIELPYEIICIFDSMLASDAEIIAKHQSDTDATYNNLVKYGLIPKRNKKVSVLKRLNNFSKTTKIFILFFVLWFMFASARTAGDIELFGIYFDRWDPDYFLLNLFTPLILGLILVGAFKWIMRS